MDPASQPRSPLSHYSLHPVLQGNSRRSDEHSLTSAILCPRLRTQLMQAPLLTELNHELKTPLTGIMGLSELLKRKGQLGAHQVHQYAELIFQKSQQLLTAVNDLIDLSQAEPYALHLHPLRLNEICCAAIHHSASSHTELGMPRLCIDWDEDTNWMLGDGHRLVQMLIHLFEYIQQQQVSPQPSYLSIRQHGMWLALGIKVEQLTLSEQDYCELSGIHSLTSSSFRQTSTLQFLLARRLAQFHGGEISILLMPAVGCEITVLLPRNLAQDDPIPRPTPSQAIGLILSREAHQVFTLHQALKKSDVLGVQSFSVRELLDQVSLLRPALVIIDSEFPFENVLPEDVQALAGFSALPPIALYRRSPQSLPANWPAPQASWLHPPTSQDVQSFWVAQAAVDTTSSAAPSRTSSVTVLQLESSAKVVSNLTEVRQLLRHLRQDHGCSMVIADSQGQAELLARIWQPSVVLCAGSLPTWFQTVSATSELRKVPVVLIECLPRSGMLTASTCHFTNNALNKSTLDFETVQSLAQQIHSGRLT